MLARWLPLGEARPFLARQLASVAAAAAATAGGAALPRLLRTTLAVASLRLRPLAPFGLTSYALANDTAAPTAAIVLGTALGSAPLLALYSFAGAAWAAKQAAGRRLVSLGVHALSGALGGRLPHLIALAAIAGLAAALLAAHRAGEREAAAAAGGGGGGGAAALAGR